MNMEPITSELKIELDNIRQMLVDKSSSVHLACEAALEKSRILHDHAAFVEIALEYAVVIDLEDYPEYAVNILYEALQLAQSGHLYSTEGALLIAIGRAYYVRAQYSRAMETWARALEVSSLTEDDEIWICAKIGVAQIYDALDDHTTAITLLTQAMQRLEPLGNNVILFDIYLNLGVNLYRNQQYSEALSIYNKGMSLIQSTNILHDYTGEIQFRIAETYITINNLDIAEQHLKEASYYCKQHIWLLANIHAAWSKIYEIKLDYTAAHAELSSAIEKAKKINSAHLLMQFQFDMCQLERNMGDIKQSLNSHLAAVEIEKSIFPRDNRQQIKELECLSEITLSSNRLLLNLSNNTKFNKLNCRELVTVFCKNSLPILKIPQASYWSFNNKSKVLDLLIRCSESSQIQTDENIKTTNHPEFFNELLHCEVIVAHTVQYHQQVWPLYDAHFKPQCISAVIIIPVRINSELHGMLCFEHCTHQHNWSQEEVQYANQLANILMRELSNIEIRKFVSEVNTLNTQLLASNDELEQRVVARTNELSSTTAHLLQTEKMAALGQLIAGVAHEINTPISAVKSSGNNIADALGHMLSNLPRVLSMLNEDCQTLFIKLLSHLVQPLEVLNSREERRIIRQLNSRLEAENIPDSYHKAYILVQLNAWGAIDDYWMLLRHPQCELILDTGYSIATINSNTANINTAVDRVSKIIFALKSFSRLDQSDEAVEASLRDGLETVLIIYQSQIKQRTELISHYDDVAPLSCYPDELNQVWTNLIHNALQAMPRSGTLSVRLQRKNNEAIIAISDTGDGIPVEIRDKIFTPFFTTKAIGEGSGLGLDIVKKIINKHHGRIELESTVGIGTTFTVYLPYGECS